MATNAQVKFFDQCLDERDFSGHDTAALREKFAQQSTANASQWIEAALKRPKKDDKEGASDAPPF